MEKGHIQKTLDHGYVKLVDYMGDDNFPLENARMSTDKPTGLDIVADDGLRGYLWRENHSSPFEMNVMCFELQLPLFVLQQVDRHRTVNIENHHVEVHEDYDSFRKFHSENEFSGRYSTLPDLYYAPLPARFGGANALNKQGTGTSLEASAQSFCSLRLKEATESARRAYDELIGAGAASEIARFAMIYTQYTKVRIQAGLKGWLDFLNLRLRTDVQLETRIYARQIARAIESLWPKTWEVFSENTLHAVKLTATERSVLMTALRIPQELHEGDDPADVPLSHRRTREHIEKVAGTLIGIGPAATKRFVDKVYPNPEERLIDYLRGELIIPESW